MTKKKVFLKMQKIFLTDGKKLFVGLKMEYYHFLKRMAWKLIVVIGDQIFQTNPNKVSKFNNTLGQIKKYQKDIDIGLFKKCFRNESPKIILEILYHLKDRPDRNNSEVDHIELDFEYFGNKVKQMLDVDKSEWKKTLIIVNKILDFNFIKLKKPA